MTGTPAAFDLHELTRSQDFVRRLAQSLVFDPDRADDAVQDAMLAALRRPPRDRAAASTWFFRVLQNGLRRRARDEARRRARERTIAADEALPSAADVLAKEQQRRRVVDAVLALPEPYRATVLARFFEDLPPQEIARRRGVPAATVRSHLHRGLELLRARFDQEHGDRRAWCQLLLPLLRVDEAAGMGSVLSFGALLMTKLFAAGALLALGLFALLWNDGVAPVASPVAAVAEVGATAASAPADDPLPTATPAAPRSIATVPAAAHAPAAPVPAGLRGRVLGSDGLPRPGARVLVLGVDSATLFADAQDRGDHRGPSLPRGEARTGDDGRFAIAGLWPRVRYAIVADADGAERTLRVADATPGPGETVDVGDLALTAKGRIVGRAIDDDGAPVAAAEVLAFDLPAALAALLPFDRLDPAHGAMLTVPVPSRSGADPEVARRELRSYLGGDLFQTAGIDDRSDTATIVVDRMPWAVDLFAAIPIARTVTGADGTFALGAVEPGGNLLVVRRQGLRNGIRPRVTARAGATQDVGDVVLAAGEEAVGRVLTANGEPVAGAEVRIAPIGPLGYRGIAFCDAAVHTDRDGRFHQGGLPAGRALFAIRRSGDEPWHTTAPLDLDGELALQLPARSSLCVRIAGVTAGATATAIELAMGPPLGELRRLGMQPPLPLARRLQWRSDDTFVIDDLPPGCATLRLEATGRAPTTAIVVLPHDGVLELGMPLAAPLTVRVRDHAGAPVAGARIHLHQREPAADEQNVLPTDYGMPRWTRLPRAVGITDERGELAVDGRPAAAVLVYASHPAFPSAVVAVGADATSAELVLPAFGELRGRLTNRGAAADPQRWSIVARAEGLEAMPGQVVRAPIAGDGSFAFAALAPGSWQLRAEPRQATPLSLHRLVDEVRTAVFSWFTDEPITHPVEVRGGAVAQCAFDVDPNLPPAGTEAAHLSGRALRDGRPLAGATLLREIDSFHRAPLCTVGADGTFVAAAVVPGMHTLLLELEGEQLWAGQVALRAGQATVLDLAFATGQLRGKATFADGRPPTHHEAVAEGRCNGGSVQRGTAVGADGRFVFPALPAGDYEVRVEGPDGRSERTAATVTAGAAVEIQVRLQPRRMVSGRVLLGDLDAGEAMLLLAADTVRVGIHVAADGSFAYTPEQPTRLELSLSVAGVEYAVEPKSVDLTVADGRDLVLRVVGPAADRGR